MARIKDHIDDIIGARLTEARIICGLSREQLATKINITHQQLSKYEKSKNRVSANALYRISKILNRTYGYFFNDDEQEMMAVDRQLLEFVKIYNKLADQQKTAVMQVARAFTNGD